VSVSETARPGTALHAEIASMVSEALQVDDLAPDTDLLETGTLDSLGLVEVLLQLERRFGVKVDLDGLDFDHFRSVANIADFVARARDGRAGSQ
jgi:D-alanine--poly(phosphoribitol) ligase subunit 2